MFSCTYSQTGTMQQATFRMAKYLTNKTFDWNQSNVEGLKENQTCKHEDEQKRWESEREL